MGPPLAEPIRESSPEVGRSLDHSAWANKPRIRVRSNTLADLRASCKESSESPGSVEDLLHSLGHPRCLPCYRRLNPPLVETTGALREKPPAPAGAATAEKVPTTIRADARLLRIFMFDHRSGCTESNCVFSAPNAARDHYTTPGLRILEGIRTLTDLLLREMPLPLGY